MNKTPIQLVVGLGNPGRQYELTRHNAGFWFLFALAEQFHVSMRLDKKLNAYLGEMNMEMRRVWLLAPMTYMNLSGRPVAQLAKFYKLTPEQILVAHDELDLAAGMARLKKGGGHGGHNGLRHIIECLGGHRNFVRLRIGIGHPGHKSLVTNYVLGTPTREDKQQIDAAIRAAIDVTPQVLDGDLQNAMNQLHQFRG